MGVLFFAALAVFAGVLVAEVLARRTQIPEAVTLVTVGVAASLLPGSPVVDLDPDVVLYIFLPPLVYHAAFLFTSAALRRRAGAIVLLAVVLVTFTAFSVAVAFSLLGFTFAAALILGAAVSPTDPTAATGVFARLRAPRRVVELIEGESLVNDAVALVLLAVAVRFATGEGDTPGHVATELLLAVLLGIGVGAVVAVLVNAARVRSENPRAALILSLAAPYLSYLSADQLGGSGVLAAVTAGVWIGSQESTRVSARSRLQVRPFWQGFEFLLSSTLFVLLGLQLPVVLSEVGTLGAITGQVVVLVVVVVAARFLWQLFVPPVVYRFLHRLGRSPEEAPRAERLLVAWCAPRGAVTLAAALSVPVDVLERSQLVFLAFTLVLVTLLQTSLLPVLLKRFEPEDRDGPIEELRRRLAQVALDALGEDSPAALRRYYQHRLDHQEGDDFRDAHRELVALQHAELDRHRATDPAAVRVLRYELDLEEERFG